MDKKPFKGPVPLGPDDFIYGRQNDLEGLIHILLSDRIVLLCSASGVGKSSLLEAGMNKETNAASYSNREEFNLVLKNVGLKARMRARDFQVLPTIRLNSDLPTALADLNFANRFMFSMLLSLEENFQKNERIAHEDLAGTDLIFYFDQRTFLQNEDKPKLLVFDQLEELMHIDPADIKAKETFISQLGRILHNPLYWAIFAMRSEYITDFDEYLDLIPTGLSSRFTLQLLSQQGAYAATTMPLLENDLRAKVAFEKEAALRLISDLSGEDETTIKSENDLSAEPKIEPLHLQVACRRLWTQAVTSKNRITKMAITQSGGVDQALKEYYEEQISKFCIRLIPKKSDNKKAGNHLERNIRKWIGTNLISQQKTRNSIYQDDQRVHELSKKSHGSNVLEELCNTYLIRRDVRNQRVLYELAHDRLVDAIVESNKTWFKKNLNPVQIRAEEWEEAKRPEEKLLHGSELHDAKKWVARQPKNETVLEAELVNESIKLEKAKKKQKRLKRALVLVFILASIGAFAGTLYFWNLKNKIQSHKAILEQQKTYLERQKADLKKRNDLSHVLLLANLGRMSILAGDYGVMDLIALQTYHAFKAYQSKYNPEDNEIEKMRDAVYQNIKSAIQSEYLVSYLRSVIAAPPSKDNEKTASTDRLKTLITAQSTTKRFAVIKDQNILRIYKYGPKGLTIVKELKLSEGNKQIMDMMFQPYSNNLAVFTSNEIRIYEDDKGAWMKPIPTPKLANIPRFDSQGSHLLGVDVEGRVYLWDTSNWNRSELKNGFSFNPSENRQIVSGFSPDGTLVSVGEPCGLVKIWKPDKPEAVYRKVDSALGDRKNCSADKERLIGLGFDSGSKWLITISSELEGIRLWPLVGNLTEPVKLLLNKEAINLVSTWRQMKNQFQRAETTVIPEDNDRPKKSDRKKSIDRFPVVASAFDFSDEGVQFAITQADGFSFIVQSSIQHINASSKPKSLDATTGFFRFPRPVTIITFVNPEPVQPEDSKLVGISLQGDVYVVDSIPEDARKKIVAERKFDPDKFEKYVCEKVWRNFTKEEWIRYMPEGPYQLTCPQFGPGFDATTTAASP